MPIKVMHDGKQVGGKRYPKKRPAKWKIKEPQPLPRKPMDPNRPKMPAITYPRKKEEIITYPRKPQIITDPEKKKRYQDLMDKSRRMTESEKRNYIKRRAKRTKEGKEIIKNMVNTAELSRSGFINGDISTVMSPRTVITWAQNYLIFKDVEYSFKLSFLNRCDELERQVIEEYYQRSFGIDITDAKVANVKE